MYKSILFACISMLCYSCNGNTIADTSLDKRIPFTINSDGTILCKMNVNDSIAGEFDFDTGADALLIDSSFWYSHYPDRKGLPYDPINLSFMFRSVRTEQHNELISFNYKTNKFTFNRFYTANIKFLNSSNGSLTIPLNDTIHIWEFNFEDNYIQIHDEFTFNPNKQITVPLKRKINEKGYQEFLIDLPLKVICENDTLISNTEYKLDLGSQYDIFYHRKSQREVQFLEKYGQNTPIIQGGAFTGRIRRNIVKCIVFDNYIVDSLRIYNSEVNLIRGNEKDGLKTIGLNFLKRFNLFFDLKNNRITFVPIEKEHIMIEYFKNEVNADFILFKDPADPDSNICFNKLLTPQKGEINIFKEMGVLEGDVFESINGIILKRQGSSANCYSLIFNILENSDTIELVIKRKGKLMTLYYNKPK